MAPQIAFIGMGLMGQVIFLPRSMHVDVVVFLFL